MDVVKFETVWFLKKNENYIFFLFGPQVQVWLFWMTGSSELRQISMTCKQQATVLNWWRILLFPSRLGLGLCSSFSSFRPSSCNFALIKKVATSPARGIIITRDSIHRYLSCVETLHLYVKGMTGSVHWSAEFGLARFGFLKCALKCRVLPSFQLQLQI
jgi:hypothetical protein